MKDILVELKGSISGIIGTFIVAEQGEVEASDVPDLMSEPIAKVAKTLHHVTNVIKATRSVDKVSVDSENARLVSIPIEKRILVVLADKNINQPLFKLMSNMAISKIKDVPTTPLKPRPPSFDVQEISELYDKLFSAAAKRLANIIGPKSATHYSDGAQGIKESYRILRDLSFDSFGKPNLEIILGEVDVGSSRDEVVEALDELLLSMLDTVRKIAGPKQEQRAMEEIHTIKSEKS